MTVPRRRGASPGLRRAALVTRLVALALGGTFALIVCMALAGIAVEATLLRVCLGLVPWVVLPAIAADRLLRRAASGGNLGLVVDVTACLWLLLALLAVGSRVLERPLVTEGDRLAEHGHGVLARAAFFLAGVSPRFLGPGEVPAPASSGAALVDAGAGAGAGTDGGAK